MKKFLLLSLALIGLAFAAVGFTEPDVTKRDLIQVVDSGDVPTSLIAIPEMEYALTEIGIPSEFVVYGVTTIDKPNKGFVNSLYRPPTNLNLIFKISKNSHSKK